MEAETITTLLRLLMVQYRGLYQATNADIADNFMRFSAQKNVVLRIDLTGNRLCRLVRNSSPLREYLDHNFWKVLWLFILDRKIKPLNSREFEALKTLHAYVEEPSPFSFNPPIQYGENQHV